jgi:hypothetical protein
MAGPCGIRRSQVSEIPARQSGPQCDFRHNSLILGHTPNRPATCNRQGARGFSDRDAQPGTDYLGGLQCLESIGAIPRPCG